MPSISRVVAPEHSDHRRSVEREPADQEPPSGRPGRLHQGQKRSARHRWIQVRQGLCLSRGSRLIEQKTAVAPERLGELVGHISRTELEQINDSLRLAFALD